MRRKAAPKRPVMQDPVYGSELVGKFINYIMRDGKKSVAERIVYGALSKLKERIKGAVKSNREHESDAIALRIFEEALHNVRPEVELKSRRVGGATYQVPVPVDLPRGISLAMRWVVDAAKGRNERGMMSCVAAELFDAYEKRGKALEKRNDVARMAKANQAFAHFRW